MGLTIVGPRSTTYPTTAYAPAIYLKRDWDDDWILQPTLRLVQASAVCQGHGLSQCQIAGSYGSIKHPWQADFATRKSGWLRGWWVALRLVGEQGYQTAFIGRISTETREIEGSAVARSGEQTWTAHGPEQILRKIHISQSYWVDVADDTVEREIGWVPSMNRRDDCGRLIGNMSLNEFQEGGAPEDTDCYRYGWITIWSHREYVRYLLRKFVNEDGTDGPTWTLGGQDAILEDMESVIEFGESETAAEMLSKLIPPKLGVDYRIRYTDDGFEVAVYALTSADWSYRGKTLPRNPNTVKVRVGQSKANVRTMVEMTDDWHFDKIRILGRRAVICCSLAGEDADFQDEEVSLLLCGTLEAKWNSALEADLKEGAGADKTPREHDRARQDDRFRSVYCALGAKDNWDPAIQGAAPLFDEHGEYVQPNLIGEGAVEDTTGDYQVQVRRTLNWTPLQMAVDYENAGAEDFNPTNHTAEYLPPCAWILSPAELNLGFLFYVRADLEGIGVSAPQNDWGVVLSCSPNHLMAANHWTGANATEVAPQYDYKMTVATFAFEADQRPTAIYEIPSGDAAPSGGVMDIVDDGIECWILAPHTIVGIDHLGRLKTSGAAAYVLREDADRMAMVMAGALGRYYQRRARAEVVIDGLMPWTVLLGQVLSTIEDAGDTNSIQAPITSIHWYAHGEDTQTVIATGFAR
jgi:hypothetical protein